MAELDFEVHLGFNLDPEEECTAILEFHADIRWYNSDHYGERDEGTVVGHVHGHLVNTYHPEFYYQADGISGDLGRAIAAVSDRDGIRDELLDGGMGCWGQVLHIGSVVLEPTYRGRKYSYPVIRTILTRIGNRCDLAVLEPCPIDTGSKVKARPSMSLEVEGRRKLGRHWAGLGFKPVPSDPRVYYLDLLTVAD